MRQELVADGLLLKASIEGKHVAVTWLGQSVSATPGTEIVPFFEKLAAHYDGGALRLDFRELEYMNSSSVRPIIELIQAANQTETEVEILYRSTIHWQRLTFKLLEMLAKEWKHVRVVS